MNAFGALPLLPDIPAPPMATAPLAGRLLNKLAEGDKSITRKPLVATGNDTDVLMNVVGEIKRGNLNPRNKVSLQHHKICLLASEVMQLHHVIFDAHAKAIGH